MKQYECEFEGDVLLAVRQGRYPEGLDEPLRAHAAGCVVCRDMAAAALAFEGAREDALAEVALPDAGRVWRQAHMRARREAVEAAGRPITAAQVIAFGAAMGLLGACFGATSLWFQAGVRYVAAVDKGAWLAFATAFLAEHGALVLGTAAAVVVLPTAVFVALGRD